MRTPPHPGAIDPRLDRHDRLRRQRRFRGLRQSWRFVHFESDSVAETVAERIALTALFNVLPGQCIGIPSRHPRSHVRRRVRVRAAHDVVDLALLIRRAPDHERARDVRAVATDDRTKIDEKEVSCAHLAIGSARVRQRGSRAGRDDGLERESPRSPRRAATARARRRSRARSSRCGPAPPCARARDARRSPRPRSARSPADPCARAASRRDRSSGATASARPHSAGARKSRCSRCADSNPTSLTPVSSGSSCHSPVHRLDGSIATRAKSPTSSRTCVA